MKIGIAAGSEVLDTTRNVNDLAQLVRVLAAYSRNQLHTFDDSAVQVFNKSREPLRVKLVEDTLTDGSTVLNIIID